MRDLQGEAIADISRRGKKALIVGGTGFYLKALLRGVWEDTEEADPGLRAELEALDSPALYARLEVLDADSAKRIGPADRYRLVRALEIIHQSGTTPSDHRRQHAGQEPLEIPLLVTDRPKDELEARMGERVDRMLQAGLLAEAQHIRERFPSSRVLNSVGYRQIFETPAPGAPAELRERIRVATRQLAKAQRTWFRGQHPEAEWFLLENDRAKLWARLHELF